MKLRTLSRDMRVELASAWAQILEETGHQVRFLNTNLLYINWGCVLYIVMVKDFHEF